MTVLQGFWRAVSPPVYSALQAIIDRRTRLTERFSFGIAFCLVAAFVGVGALVLAANFIVERGASTERTIEITRAVPAPATVSKPVKAIVPAPVDPPPQPRPERHVVSSDRLMLALGEFSRAVHDRVETKTEESDAEYQRAVSELDRASEDFLTQAAVLRAKSVAKLPSTINAHKKDADELVRVSDKRREMMSDYLALFEVEYARVHDSLKGAWKVFGRVVARQSLVQLDADLDALRRSTGVLSSAVNAEAPALQPLVATEQAVINNLNTNERGFRHSEGDRWYSAMREDFSRLVALRGSLLQANQELVDHSHEFAEASAGVAALIPKQIEGPVIVLALKSKQTAEKAKALHVPTATAVARTAPVEPVRAVVQTHSVTTHAAKDKKKRALIAWLSVAVVSLLVAIAVLTVASIVGPVRRLCDATRRLAKGEGAVRVRRGGIRELDTLAVAFNVMAEELALAKAAASDYQQGLEVKVAERTQQLEELAQHDPLTGLPNRRQLFVLLNAAIERAQCEGCRVGVFFLDIDNFKYLNDTMGHAFGDRVLICLARRLLEATRAIGFAARLGGDEFTVVFEHAGSEEEISIGRPERGPGLSEAIIG